jgi:hypothetical protein
MGNFNDLKFVLPTDYEISLRLSEEVPKGEMLPQVVEYIRVFTGVFYIGFCL